MSKRNTDRDFKEVLEQAKAIPCVRLVVEATGGDHSQLWMATQIIRSLTSWVAASNIGELGRAEIDRVTIENARLRALVYTDQQLEERIEETKRDVHKQAEIVNAEVTRANEDLATMRAQLEQSKREHEDVIARMRQLHEAQTVQLRREVETLRSERDQLAEAKRRLRDAVERANTERKQLEVLLKG